MSKTMIIGIHKDPKGHNAFSDRWAEYLGKQGVHSEFINMYEACNNLISLKKYAGIMWRWGLEYPERELAIRVLDLIEDKLNIPVYPIKTMREVWDDKIKQWFVFQTRGIKTPQTYLFFRQDDAIDWSQNTDYPKVFKLSGGAHSDGVCLVKTPKEARRLINKMFTTGIWTNESLTAIRDGYGILPNLKRKVVGIYKPRQYRKNRDAAKPEKGYVLFQEFISGNNYDTRIHVQHGRALGYRRMNRQNDFRASGSGMKDYVNVDHDIILKAFEVVDKLGMECASTDFLRHNGELVLTEICWTCPDRVVWECKHYWDRNLIKHPGQHWPEEWQVEYFIERVKNWK